MIYGNGGLVFMVKLSVIELQLEIGNAVAEARRRNGFTQQGLARKLGTRQANISRIERGMQNLSLDFLVRLNNALGLDLKIEIG
jgi:transcriptional regulator with XRE-family HTH domain